MIETKTNRFYKKIISGLPLYKPVWIKIKTIFPLWGIGLSLVLSVVMASSIWKSPLAMSFAEGSPTASMTEPQVLGAAIDLRGELPAGPLPPILTRPIIDEAVTAQSYLVADLATGQIIAQRNAEKKQYIASLTKLLTALVTYQQASMSATVPITSEDVFNISPVLGLKAGDEVSLTDLFNAMLIGSCNDAALTLSHYVQKTTHKNFVDLMNATASNLGMTQSHFSNALGFDSPTNYSTSEDLLKLVLATQKFAAFTQLGKKTTYSFIGSSENLYKTTATDKLIAKHTEIEGIKTGFTEGAGQAMITKATKNNHKIIIIVLGSKDREADTLELEKQIFTNAIWK